MASVTYSEVHALVQQLPPERLPAAYQVLQELAQHGDKLQAQLEFRQLQLAERREILARQADAMKTHYERESDERLEWQSGEFTDEGPAG